MAAVFLLDVVLAAALEAVSFLAAGFFAAVLAAAGFLAALFFAAVLAVSAFFGSEKTFSRYGVTPEGHHNVIDLMADQQGNIPKGGTMRLGKYPCAVLPGTKMAECYGQSEIWERHRHRYEFNNEYRQEMQDAGLVISGTSPDGRLVETVELPGRDFHLGAQFHPEFKSRPNRAHPLFKGFIAAALKAKKEKMGH